MARPVRTLRPRPPRPPAKRQWPSFASLRAQYGARVLFSLAVVLLIALGSWWLLLIGQSIRTQHQMSTQLIDRDVWVAAMRLAFSPDQLKPGQLPEDERLELAIVGAPIRQPARWVGDGETVGEGPADPQRHWFVQPSQTWADKLTASYERRKGMVVGEGLLLTSLLAIVVAMLYHLIRTEAKFRREMQEFLGRATHEMKTPLAGIKAVLQTLQVGRVPQDAQKDLLKLALAELEREEHLVQNMLLAQRMRMPNQQLARERVDIAGLFNKFAEHRGETMGDKIALAVDCQEGAVACGDATALWTVLENLADNAVKYGAKQLTMRGTADDRHAHLELVDDGMGFEPERARSLFESYSVSAGPAVGKHGTGLGLSICRTLVIRMGGKITAHSDGPGQGARFRVVLPVWKQSA